MSITLTGLDGDIVSGTITLSDGNGHTATHTLTAAEIAAGTVTLQAGDFSGFGTLNHADSLITVSATVTDNAGNSATPSNANFMLDTTADADNNLVLSAFNAAGGVNAAAVSITLAGLDSDIVSGTITLSDGNGHTATHTLTAAEIAAGTVTLQAGDFSGFGTLNHADSLITVSATVTDNAGNQAAPSNASFTLDTTADADNNLVLSAFNAAGGVNAAAVSITLAGLDSDIVSGTITLSDGTGHTATHTLTAAEIAAGTVTLLAGDFSGFGTLNHADSLITVSATVTDNVGNQATPSNASFTLDTTADADSNLVLSAFNAAGGVNTAAVSITLAGLDSDIVSGTITLSDGNGHTATHTLTAAEIAAGTVTLQAGDFSGFGTLNHADSLITVSATVTDNAGNPATPSNASFTLDSTADADSNLVLSAFNAAGGVNAAAVSITLAGLDGDIVSSTITLSDGNGHTATHTLTAAEIAAGTVTLQAGDFSGFGTLNHADSLITVSATVTDNVGNQATPSNANFTLDTTADADNNLVLSAFNAAGGVNAAAVSITLAGLDGDIVSGMITLSDGNGHIATHTLTAAEIAAGTVTLQAGAFSGFGTLNHADSLITVSATVTDNVGNQATPSNANFTLDTTADADNNLVLSAFHAAGGGGQAIVVIRLSGIDSDIVSGTITLSDGHGHTATHTLTAAEIAAGTVTLQAGDFSGFGTLNHADSLITVSATVTDNAGNAATPASDSFVLDSTADADNNLVLSAFNAAGGVNAAAVSITLTGLDGDIVSGKITLSDGNGHTATHTLTAAEIAAGTVTLQAGDFSGFGTLNHADSLITVSALLTDDAGNSAAPSNANFTLDTTGDTGTALVLSAFNAAGGVNAAAVSITLAGLDGDIVSSTITLSDGNGHTATHTLTAAEIAAGTVTLQAGDFSGFGTLNHADSLITVSATVTDNAGNQAAPSNANFTLDTTGDPNDFDFLATGSYVTVSGSNVFGTTGNDEIEGGTQSQTIYAGAGSDEINGSNSGDTIYGGSGDDQIKGNNGTDTLYGGSGSDTINGGNGSDVIVGGFGADTLTGGAANDTFKYLSTLDSQPGAADTINDFSSGDKIDVSAIDANIATSSQDAFTFVAAATQNIQANSLTWYYDQTTNQTIIQGDADGNTSVAELEIHLNGHIELIAGDFIVH